MQAGSPVSRLPASLGCTSEWETHRENTAPDWQAWGYTRLIKGRENAPRRPLCRPDVGREGLRQEESLRSLGRRLVSQAS